MKIAFVLTEMGYQKGGGFIGGTVNNVAVLSRELAMRGHDVKVITNRPRDAAPNYRDPIDWADVYCQDPVPKHGSLKYYLSFVKFALNKIWKLHYSNDIDIVTVHSGFSVWSVIASISNILWCPSLPVLYCPISQSSGYILYDVLQSAPLSKVWLTSCRSIVASTNNIADSVRRISKDKNITIIPSCVDTDRYSISENRIHKRESNIRIAYMGSLKKQKGLDVLIRSFENIVNKYNVTLHLGLEVRSEKSGSDMWKKIESHSSIHEYGVIDDVPSFLSKSDLFVIPFRSTVGPADYPVAALEAMSCETPIITSNVGGLPTLVTETDSGIVLNNLTSEELTKVLSETIENCEHLDKLGRNARLAIKKHFSVDKVADKYERLFSKISSNGYITNSDRQ